MLEFIGIWLILLLIGIAGLVGVRTVFAPGWRRSAAYALIAGVFLTPTLIFGHGAAIIPALVGVFAPYPTGNWDMSLMFASLRVIAVAIVLIFVIHASAAAVVGRNSPQDHARSGSARSEMRWLSLMVGLLVCAFAAEWAYRAHWRIYKASIGPFSITVDTGSPALSDVGAIFECSKDGIPVFMGRKKLQSDGTATFPAQYIGAVRGPFQCKLGLSHPELPGWYRVELTVDAKPRQHVNLQASAPRWSQERMLKDPLVGSTPERDFYWDTNELTMGWLPFMCRSDLERAKRLYIPLLLQRRRDVLAGRPPLAPDEDYAKQLAESWSLTCEGLASRPPGLP